ncbi:protein of unknown function (plasmid) [Rhodovastum atsumiense]|uniref:LamG domain-containing protein n=1 Tax=Rhodovastum atsumiense TaxID=504468 RepID=UPI00139F2AFE|nr:LamG domain-containing protein [Rhodovastum atsumiense]CAH2606348.1 protein of unknown function [Rhodovastum atsumiense]
MTALFRPGVPMRARLLGRLNRVFDKRPVAVLALRIRSYGGLRWRVKGRVLTVYRPDMPALTLLLEGRTIAQLRDDLAAADVSIAYYADDPAVLVQGALSLVEGEGDQDTSNGDWLWAYTSILYGWADAVGRWLDMARADIPQALRQLVIPQSEGEWSELWASYFGLARKRNETDERLNFRTVYEWRRARSNPFAIQANIKALLGQNITVREPWREMFTLSESALSGADHMPDAVEFCYHTAQLISADYLDWDEVMIEAEADRPAGTLYLAPVTIPPPAIIRRPDDIKVFAFASLCASWLVQDMDGMILSVNAGLSDSFVRMAPALSRAEWTSLHAGPLPHPPAASFHPQVFCKGEIILSEGPALGDLNAHFPGTMLVEEGDGGMEMSGGTGLSDYAHRLVWVPIDEWFEDANGGGWDPPEYPGMAGIHPGVSSSSLAVNEEEGSVWAGAIMASFGAIGGWGPGLIGLARTDEIKRQPIAGTAAAQAVASAGLKTGKLLAGSVQARAVASAGLTTAIRLAGSIAAQAAGWGTLSTGAGLFGASAQASSAATADLTTGILLVGAAAAQSAGAGTLTDRYGFSLSSYAIGTIERDAVDGGKARFNVTVTTRGEPGENDSVEWVVFTSGNATRGSWTLETGTRTGKALSIVITANGDYVGFRKPGGGSEAYATAATIRALMASSISARATATAAGLGSQGSSDLTGTAQAGSAASASLTTGVLLAGAAAAQSSGAGDLTTGILLAGAGGAQSSGTGTLTDRYRVLLNSYAIGTIERDPADGGKARFAVTVTTQGEGTEGDRVEWAVFSSTDAMRGSWALETGTRAGKALSIVITANGDYLCFRKPGGGNEAYATAATIRALLSGAISASSTATAVGLAAQSNLAGTAQASSMASADLTTGILLAGAAAAQSSGAGTLTDRYSLSLSSYAIGTIERDPADSGRARFNVTVTTKGEGTEGDRVEWVVFNSANAARGSWALETGTRAGKALSIVITANGDYLCFRKPDGGNEAYATAATIRARMASSISASSTATATLPLDWPTADMAAQLSPDATSFVTSTGGSPDYVNEVRDVLGTSYYLVRNEVASDLTNNPTLALVHGRRMMAFSGAQRLDSASATSSNDLAGLFAAVRGPRTVAAVVRTPDAWPTQGTGYSTILPVANEYWVGSNGYCVGITIQNISGLWRPMLKTTDSGGNGRSVIGNGTGQELQPGTVYFIVARWNGDGTGDLFVNGVKLTVNRQGTMPAESTNHPTARRFSVGYTRTDASSVLDNFFYGHIGDLLFYNVAKEDAWITGELQTAFASRYPG